MGAGPAAQGYKPSAKRMTWALSEDDSDTQGWQLMPPGRHGHPDGYGPAPVLVTASGSVTRRAAAGRIIPSQVYYHAGLSLGNGIPRPHIVGRALPPGQA